MYLIAFVMISFLLNVVALRIGSKAAKAETGTWANALKASALMFLASLALSGLGGYLQTLSLTTQADSMRQVYGGLAALLGLASLAANIYIIMKVFALNGGETVKAILITLVVDFFFHAILIGIFVALFFGTFFKMATTTLVTPGTGIVISTEENGKPKLPKMPSGETTDQIPGTPCKTELDCPDKETFCVNATCQTSDQIKQLYGFRDNDPAFNPCKEINCPDCSLGKQMPYSISAGVNLCIECTNSNFCNAHFKCENYKCIPELPLPDQPSPATQPSPALAPVSDPESLKRDDARIAKMNETLAAAKAASASELSQMTLGAGLVPCPPTDGYPYQPKTFLFGDKSCNTTYFKEFSDGFIILIGIENASKANLDTRKLPPTPPSTVQDISSLLGSVSADTPSQNLTYAIVIEQPGKAKARLETRSVSYIADLTNISMALEVYYNDHGEYPAAESSCLAPADKVYEGIKNYMKGALVPTPADPANKTLNCLGSYYYKSLELKGKANGAYVLATDVPAPEKANFELPASLDASLFTSYDAIASKIGKLTQESDNPLRSAYVLIP